MGFWSLPPERCSTGIQTLRYTVFCYSFLIYVHSSQRICSTGFWFFSVQRDVFCGFIGRLYGWKYHMQIAGHRGPWISRRSLAMLLQSILVFSSLGSVWLISFWKFPLCLWICVSSFNSVSFCFMSLEALLLGACASSRLLNLPGGWFLLSSWKGHLYPWNVGCFDLRKIFFWYKGCNISSF